MALKSGEMAGLKVPADVQGASLVPVLKDGEIEVKEAAVSFNDGAAWRTADWAYMRYRDGTEELYDMNADPGQITNLAERPEHQAMREKLAAGLKKRLESL